MKAQDCIKGNRIKIVNGYSEGVTGTFISRERTSQNCYMVTMKTDDGRKLKLGAGHVQPLHARKSQYAGKVGRPMTAK